MEHAITPDQITPIVPGRSCGTCTLCCKVYEVLPLNKPAGKWCSHCSPGRGCGIHETKPDLCSSFNCFYLTEGRLSDEWKPEVSKFVISIDPNSGYMHVRVDPGQPRAWMKEPYLQQLRVWAEAMLPRGQLVIVFVNQQATLVAMNGMTDLGILQPDERVGVKMRVTPTGPVYDIIRTKVSS
jgi:hypothetical protein